MKKKLDIMFYLLFIGILVSCSKDIEENIEETEVDGFVIEIVEIRNNDGQIILDLTDENENKIDTVYAEIENKKCIITLTDLPVGRYAFQFIHDENGNNELDVNAFGIPVEGYGFSRNANGTFGPPDMEEMVFDYNGSLKMECTMTYLFK